MDHISSDELKKLALISEYPCVSLQFPLHNTVAEVEQNAKRLRNLADEAEKRMAASGLDVRIVRQRLAPIRELQKQTGNEWLSNGDAGVTVLSGSDVFRCFATKYPSPDGVSVDERFALSPLVYGMNSDDQFLMLGLSPKQLKLYRCTSNHVEEIELPDDVPRSMDKALAGTEIIKSLQHHTVATAGAGTGPGMIHGQGSPKDDEKKLLQEYFRIVSKHVEGFIGNDGRPLVVAGVEYYHPMFRETCRYPQLIEQGVRGSADELTPQELHQRAVPLVNDRFDKSLVTATGRFGKLRGTERAHHKIETILPFAIEGRVETIFAAVGERIWGVCDAESRNVVTHDAREDADIDLLDRAVVHTIASGGNAYVVDPDRVPESGKVAAILRW